MKNEQCAIGIDIGGTFTDVVIRGDRGSSYLAKFPSTRPDPSAAVSIALEALGPRWGISAEQVNRFVHGTTVATNAVLERKGARVGLLATEGFTDVLEIGRQNRQELYDLIIRPQTPAFLSPGRLRRGVVERIGPAGDVQVPLDLVSLAESVDALAALGAESIAICFLFSFVNPTHERAAADFIRERHPELMISLSSEVDPAFREYERTCVTAFDAYVKPVLDRYLAAMEKSLETASIRTPLQIMQSRGGTSSSRIARAHPVRLFLSGPAAGVIGANAVGLAAGFKDLITVDIGGTSSDIALIMDGVPIIRAQGYVDSYTVRVPMIDVNAVGSGGGSIAWIDAAGGLRVGPQSAGAEPGPACYARGGSEATVTDASVVLGLLNPAYFAAGTLKLEPDLAYDAIERKVARPLGLTVEEAALGIHRVANVQMAEGIRLVSIRRGIDPRSFALVPFGGAGPVHATALADELGITTIVVPRSPGVLSASGLLSARIEHEASTTFIRNLSDLDVDILHETCRALTEDCFGVMAEEGLERAAVETKYFADVCYIGQAHYVEVPLDLDSTDVGSRLYADFCRIYEQQYGHHTKAPARIVNLRVVQQDRSARDNPVVHLPKASERDIVGTTSRPMLTQSTNGRVAAAVVTRDDLTPGASLHGPAIVEQPDTTIVVEPGWCATSMDDGVVIIRRMA